MADAKIVTGSGWTRLQGSAMISNGPVVVHGLVVKASAANSQTTLYNGNDATAGLPVIIVEGPANESLPITFPAPLRLENGAYVNLGTNVEEVLVVWDPAGPTR